MYLTDIYLRIDNNLFQNEEWFYFHSLSEPILSWVTGKISDSKHCCRSPSLHISAVLKKSLFPTRANPCSCVFIIVLNTSGSDEPVTWTKERGTFLFSLQVLTSSFYNLRPHSSSSSISFSWSEYIF